jgi:hypothetical protein
MFSSSIVSQVKDQFVFIDLDAKLIDLWTQAKSGKSQNIQKIFDDVKTTWTNTKSYIKSNQIEHFDNKPFIKSQDALLPHLEAAIRSVDLSNVEFYTYHFIWEFREMRSCFTYDEYTFDQLWETYDAHQQMSYILGDQMMGLYEWNEFIIYYGKFKKEFDLYKQMVNSSMVEGIDFAKFKKGILKAEECIAEFEIALKSAFRPDFELPCNQIEAALIDLFKLYKVESSIVN